MNTPAACSGHSMAPFKYQPTSRRCFVQEADKILIHTHRVKSGIAYYIAPEKSKS